jgi:hypothetical protein
MRSGISGAKDLVASLKELGKKAIPPSILALCKNSRRFEVLVFISTGLITYKSIILAEITDLQT